MTSTRQTVLDGIVAGLLGAATVAVRFLLCDTATERPLYTPALLGAAVPKGLRDPSMLHISTAAVLGYTVLHATAFILFGILAAVPLAIAERKHCPPGQLIFREREEADAMYFVELGTPDCHGAERIRARL